MQDRFVKIMLVAIAALLALNVFHLRSQPDFQIPSIVGSAQAQTVTPTPTTPQRPDIVRNLNGFPVEELKEVVALGDGRTFIVSNDQGFMVYQVNPAPVR